MPCTTLTIEAPKDTLAISGIGAIKKGTGLPQQVEISISFTGTSSKKRYVVVNFGENDKETWDVPAGVQRISKSLYFGAGSYNICAVLIE